MSSGSYSEIYKRKSGAVLGLSSEPFAITPELSSKRLVARRKHSLSRRPKSVRCNIEISTKEREASRKVKILEKTIESWKERRTVWSKEKSSIKKQLETYNPKTYLEYKLHEWNRTNQDFVKRVENTIAPSKKTEFEMFLEWILSHSPDTPLSQIQPSVQDHLEKFRVFIDEEFSRKTANFDLAPKKLDLSQNQAARINAYIETFTLKYNHTQRENELLRSQLEDKDKKLRSSLIHLQTLDSILTAKTKEDPEALDHYPSRTEQPQSSTTKCIYINSVLRTLHHKK